MHTNNTLDATAALNCTMNVWKSSQFTFQENFVRTNGTLYQSEKNAW